MMSPAPHWLSRALFICCLAAVSAPALAQEQIEQEPQQQEQLVDFNRDVRPILSDKCFACHGFDENERQADLRLDNQQGAYAELASGSRAIVPGDISASALVERITAEEEYMRMPPEASGKTLTPQEIDLLTRWVEQGGEYKAHWSFIPPQRPEPPRVAREELVANEIDRFVQARLEKEGLQPSPQADKQTLIRRVTLDLTGLPPTPQEVDEFLADQRDDAYGLLVDRLLASPRYGEHMARYWLDAARYGDTHGLHFDNERSLWPYRDWVIEAFNRNQPFDQFTVEQLAGDLLPNPTMEQRIATGFNRANVSTSEGGSIDEEVLVRYAVDRVETTSTVWLGLTTGCAVCHDHKFDPITQKEFYELFAYFNAVAEAAMDGNAMAPPPIIQTPTAEQTAQKSSLEGSIASLRESIAAELARIEYSELPGAGTAPGGPHEFIWIDDALPTGAKPSADADWKFVSQLDRPVQSGQKAVLASGPGMHQRFFTGANPLVVGEGDKLIAYVYLDPADPPKTIMLQFNDGSWEHRAFWGDDLIEFGASGSPGRLPMGPLPAAGGWVRLEVEAAKVGLSAGAKINGWAFTQYAGTVFWDQAGIVTRVPQAGQQFESLAAWDAAQRAHPASSLPAPVAEAVKVDPAARTPEQQTTVKNHFLETAYAAARPIFGPLHQRADELNKELAQLDAAIPRTMVMADLPQPRDTFVLVRGAYDKKGEKVTPGVPAVLGRLPETAPPNRLGLAQWLVDPGHPLTARVTVNRYWQHYFGTGLVKTPGDFGAQGEWPTHPALLDWLATEFIQSGWDIKHMQKLIVMSATYRQSSHVTPELFARDPENLLLARGPRFRMDAEMIRDSALAVSGLLIERLGGRSVKPYQPEGIWEAVAFVGSNTSIYKQDDGGALYRRGIYTFWKRTSPPPSLTTFDAPSRENCTVRRPRTNTPLQALVLMNDTQYIEVARHMARRMLIDVPGTAEERAAYGFRLATSRQPQSDEVGVLVRTFNEQLAEYWADPAAAARLLEVGASPHAESLDPCELAAWTMVANLILNLDETVTKQ